MAPRNIEEIDEDVRQHRKDLYIGNGKPGLTTRVLILEDYVKSIHFYGRWLLLTCAGILVVAVLDLIIKR